MKIVFKKQAYAVYFIKKETKEFILDSVFLSPGKAMQYAADFNEWEKKEGEGDTWICQPIDFDDKNESLFGGLPAVLAFLLVSYILMWIFC